MIPTLTNLLSFINVAHTKKPAPRGKIAPRTAGITGSREGPLLILAVNLVVDNVLETENLAEALHILVAPVAHDLAVGAELVAHQVVLAVDTHHDITVGIEIHVDIAADRNLRTLQHGLHVPHHRIVVLTLVQPVAVELRDLVLPEQLPLGEGVLLEHLVGGDDEDGACGLESHSALDADDGVADVHVAPYAVGAAEALDLADGVDRIGVLPAVDTNDGRRAGYNISLATR